LDLNEGSHHSQELLTVGNKSGKLGRSATMENVTTPIGKPLFKERITMVETITNLKHEVCKLIKLRVQ
jgi:hypothetical protein